MQRESVSNNRGLILGKSNGKEVVVKAKIGIDNVVFQYGRAKARAKIYEPFCEVETTRSKDKAPEKRIFDNLKLAIKNLVQDEQVEFEAGIMALCEYVYSFVVIPNGFLLHLELLPDNFLSFGVVHQNGTILLAKQQGAWDLKRQDQDVIDICKDYLAALDRIIKESDEAFKTIVSEYAGKKLIN